MAFFLAKTDPETYSAADLKKERRTRWDGVTNPQAVGAIKAMKPGDTVFVYHSGGAAAVVALGRVVSSPQPDPGNAKSWTVEIEFLADVDPPCTLAEIKSCGLFADWALVRQGRLSTMSAPAAFVEWMRKRYPRVNL
jgi:predicted RNA-binding protein with PUA-like domain